MDYLSFILLFLSLLSASTIIDEVVVYYKRKLNVKLISELLKQPENTSLLIEMIEHKVIKNNKIAEQLHEAYTELKQST